MHRLILSAVCLSTLLVGCGSSSNNDTGTLAAACESASTDLCNRASSCGKLSQLGFSSVSACISYLESASACSTKVCPSGTTYNSSQASTCLSDIQNGPCGSGLATSCGSGYSNLCK